MKQGMRRIRFLALGCLLAFGGLAMNTSAEVIPGLGATSWSVVYYNDAGGVVGVRMGGCGDPGWGEVTLNSRYYVGCIM